MNLRFISEYHGYPPGEVIKMRTAGKDFLFINAEIKNGKEEDLGEQGKRKEKERRQGQEKGKGKGKGKD